MLSVFRLMIWNSSLAFSVSRGFFDIQNLKNVWRIYKQILGDGFGWFKLVWKYLQKLLRTSFASLSRTFSQYQENCCLNLADLFVSLRMIASTLCKRVMIVLNLFSVNKMCFWRTRDKTQFWIGFSLLFAIFGKVAMLCYILKCVTLSLLNCLSYWLQWKTSTCKSILFLSQAIK